MYACFVLPPAGVFDAANGTYTVEPDAHSSQDPASMPQRHEEEGTNNLGYPYDQHEDSKSMSSWAYLHQTPAVSQRSYFVLDLVSHPIIKEIPCQKFFHRCWQNGLCFDIDQRTGVIFNLSDAYISGALGLLSVGLTMLDVYSQMHTAMAFIPQQGIPQAPGQLSSVAFNDLLALVKYLEQNVRESEEQAFY